MLNNNLQNLSDLNRIMAAITSGQQLEQTANNVRLVLKQDEAVHIIEKKLLRRDGKGIYVSLLHCDKEGHVCPKIQPQDWGRLAEFLQNNGFLEETLMISGLKRKRVKRFSRAILMASVEDMNGLGFLYTQPVFDENGNITKPASFKAIYRSISPDGKDRFWMRINKGGKGYMVAISDLNEQEVLPLEEWKDMVADNGYYVYEGSWGSCSPGELKGHTVRLPGNYVGPQTNRKIDWSKYYHELTAGAWTEWCHNGGSSDWAQIGEFNSRCTLGNAYHKRLDALPIRAYALYGGKFQDSNGYEYMDGLTLLSANYFAEALTEESEGKIIFSEEAVTGLLAQVRPFLVNKVTTLSVSDELLSMFLNRLGTERINFLASSMTADQQRAWCAVADKARRKDSKLTTCKIDGKDVDLNKKLIVVYWDEDTYNRVSEYQKRLLSNADATGDPPEGWIPDFVTDLNGQKTYFYPWEFESGLNMLAIAHPDNGKAVLSTQVLTSYAANNFDQAMQMVDVLGSMQIDKAREHLFETEGVAPSFLDFQIRKEVKINEDTGEEFLEQKTPNYVDIVQGIAPTFSLEQSATAWRRRVDQRLKSLSKMFSNLNIPVDGTHTTILPDLFAMFCGQNVLGENKGIHEIYSHRSNAATITADEYINRGIKLLKEQHTDVSEIEEIVKAIKGLSAGISVVPATEITAKANEGWDFDGDSMYTFKMDRGYKKVSDHFVWCEDSSAEGRITLGHINRYPKTHPYGYMRCLEDTKLQNPYGVCIEE